MNAVYQIGGVTKQAVHKHLQVQTDWSEKVDELRVQVDEIRSVHPGCGLEKLYDTLKPDWLGRDKFISTFMELGYRIKKRPNFIRTTIPAVLRYPNLIQGLLVYDKNRVWQTDITYFELGGRFYYLTFIVDIYTKVIRGYEASDNMRAEANLWALNMALKESKFVTELIHHSDRGSQFVDNRYRNLLKTHGIHMSMGLIAQDNAYAERINGTLKNEYLKGKVIDSFTVLKKELKIAVNHYNEKRIHRHLPGKQSPRQFEKQLLDLSTQTQSLRFMFAQW